MSLGRPSLPSRFTSLESLLESSSPAKVLPGAPVPAVAPSTERPKHGGEELLGQGEGEMEEGLIQP